MITGLPLDIAIKLLGEQGQRVEIKYTRSPRRARELGEGKPEIGCARVIRYASGEIVCAYFNEPDFSAPQTNLPAEN